MSQNEVLVVAFVGSGILGLVAIVGGFLQVRRERLLVHAERMKALELGRPLPDDEHVAEIKAYQEAEGSGHQPRPWAPARKCFQVAVWVPVGCAIFGIYNGHSVAPWVATAFISVAALVCGTFLSIHPPSAEPMPPVGSNGLASKPAMDPDAFDVAGRRGG